MNWKSRVSSGSVRLTEAGDIRVTDGGLYRVTEDFFLSAADLNYDFISAIELAAPGVVVQEADIDAVSLAWAINGFVALTSAQIIALVGPLPTSPDALPRFPDAYGGMTTPQGWSRSWPDTVVNP